MADPKNTTQEGENKNPSAAVNPIPTVSQEVEHELENVNEELAQAPAVDPQAQAPVVGPQAQAPAVDPQAQAPVLDPQAQAPVVDPQAQAPAVGPQVQAPAVDPQAQAPAVDPQAQAPTPDVEHMEAPGGAIYAVSEGYHPHSQEEIEAAIAAADAAPEIPSKQESIKQEVRKSQSVPNLSSMEKPVTEGMRRVSTIPKVSSMQETIDDAPGYAEIDESDLESDPGLVFKIDDLLPRDGVGEEGTPPPLPSRRPPVFSGASHLYEDPDGFDVGRESEYTLAQAEGQVSDVEGTPPPLPSRRPPVSPGAGHLYEDPDGFDVGREGEYTLAQAEGQISDVEGTPPPLPSRRPPVSPGAGHLYEDPDEFGVGGEDVYTLAQAEGQVPDAEDTPPPLPGRRPPVAPGEDNLYEDPDEFDVGTEDVYTFAQAADQELGRVDSVSWSSLRDDYLNNNELNEELLLREGPVREICDMIVQSHGNLSQRSVNKIVGMLQNGGEAISEQINEPLKVTHPDGNRDWPERVMPLLHAACLYNVNPEVVKAIANAGGNFGLGDASNKLPLHHAARYGSPSLIDLCLKNTNPSQMNVKDIYGDAPIICLSHNPKCSKENIDEAMRSGADLGTCDADGRLPFHHIAHTNTPSIINHALRRMEGSPMLRNRISDQDLSGNNVAHFAASNGNISEKFIKVLKNLGIDIHGQNISGRTPLSYAVCTGSQKVVSELLSSSGSKVNTPDVDGCTPLHHAVKTNRLKSVKQIMGHPSVNPAAVDNRGCTAVHHAVIRGLESVLKELSSDRGKSRDVREGIRTSLLSKDALGNTPLHIACAPECVATIPRLLKAIEKYYGKDGVVHALQESNDGKDRVDLEGLKSDSVLTRPLAKILSTITNRDIPLSPLHKAIQESNITAVEKIIAATSPDILKQKTPQGLNSIQLAAMYANPEMVKYIAKRSSAADINDPGNAVPPLNLALLYGSPEHAKALLANKSVDCTQPMGDDQNTILHAAAFRGDVSLLKEVLKHPGVDVNAVNAQGKTALHIAVERGDLTAVDKLCRVKKCNVNVQDENGHTPLSMAISRDVSEKLGMAIIKLLLKTGADVTLDADYAIGEAVGTRSHDILSMLIDSGAKVSSTNQAPLECAVTRGDRSSIDKVVRGGGNVNHIVNNPNDEDHGLNLLMLAIKNEKLESVKSLIKNKCDVSKYNGDNTFTALHMLPFVENQEFAVSVAKEILTSGSKKNQDILSKQDVNGNTPLHLMISSGRSDLCNTVMKRVSNQDLTKVSGIQNSEGNNLLHVAVEQGNADILSDILQLTNKSSRSNVVNAKNGEGNTPLHVAAKENKYDILKIMLKSLPNKSSVSNAFNVQDSQGQNLLHIAAERGDSRLFARGLRSMDSGSLTKALNARDSNGNTPVHLALAAGIKEVKSVIGLCNQETLLVPNNEGKLPSQCIEEGSIFASTRGFVTSRVSIQQKLMKAEQKAFIRGPESSTPLVSESSSISSSSSSIDFPQEMEISQEIRGRRFRFISDSSDKSTTEVPEPPLRTQPQEYSINVFDDSVQRTRQFDTDPGTLSSSSSVRPKSLCSSFRPESSDLESQSTSSLEFDRMLSGDPNLQGEIAQIAEGMSDVVQSQSDVENERVSPASSQGTLQKKSSCMEK
ncbi:ankyrin repeat domain-containing protein [Ehrlichia ruminantium]|uniref:ankyrin repeat domain-containing protein n=1 Tax=Ehrlichia ruminantium TaxID=779 RepID=UPI0007A05674|nr:ankyrin repeat domain-containing protein [Ehrlichia ruminantium]KYW90910.1 hypothetical protein AUR40_03620 [Ehrlichia ruminantium]